MFLPGESQGRGSLVGCRLWGRTELDTIAAVAAKCYGGAELRELVIFFTLRGHSSWVPIFLSCINPFLHRIVSLKVDLQVMMRAYLLAERTLF